MTSSPTPAAPAPAPPGGGGGAKPTGHMSNMLLGMLPGRVSGMFYRRKNLLGAGAYAKVYDCQRYSDAHDFAIKIFEPPQEDDDEETIEYMTSCLQREMGMMEAFVVAASLARKLAHVHFTDRREAANVNSAQVLPLSTGP